MNTINYQPTGVYRKITERPFDLNNQVPQKGGATPEEVKVESEKNKNKRKAILGALGTIGVLGGSFLLYYRKKLKSNHGEFTNIQVLQNSAKDILEALKRTRVRVSEFFRRNFFNY